MKKQILFLAMFTLALIFAGTKSFGQTYINYVEPATAGAIACTPAISLNCANNDGELTPIPGKTYTYGVTVTPGTFQSIHWFVTDISDVILASTLAAAADRDVIDGDYILNAGSGLLAGSADYDNDANTTPQISISWKSFNGTSNNVLLVAYVTGAAGCSDNIEVYRIEPSIGFTLDIAGLLDDGTIGDEECLSPVESAQYDGANLNMDYGENWIFFTVNAANFVHSWQPDFTTAYTGAGTVSAVEWAYPADAEADVNWKAESVPVEAQDASGAVGPVGECIVLRVQIDHGGDELDASVAAAILTMGVDGIMYDSENDNYTNSALADLDNNPSGVSTDPCVNNVTDEADYTLTPRPSIVTNTTVGTGDKAFEPKLP